MTVLRAGWVLPVDGPALRDAAVAVEGGRVAWVGPMAEAPAGDVRDLGPGVLLPGLVNAHCHLELSHLAGRLDASRGFVRWVEDLVTARPQDPPETVHARAATALARLETGGTAAVGDVSNALAHLDLLGRSPVRARVFHELIGWDPALAGRVMDQARSRRAEAPNGVPVDLAAHAPHSVSPALFAEMREGGGPHAVHLAESPHERRFLQEGDVEWSAFLAGRGLAHVPWTPPGRSPVRYLDGLGVLHPGLLAAHAVQVDEDDAALLSTRGVAVALCPRSNRALDVGRAPLPLLREKGVRLAVGTDSLASVPDLDLWQDVLLLHHHWPRVEREWLLRAATLAGAQALGFADLGRIAPGAAALFAFAEGPRDLRDPLAFLFSGEARLGSVRA